MKSYRKGTVYLVGAGPGDPELLTVKGLNLLRQADVIVHDRLVNRDLLDEAPLDAELIDVGKRPGRHAVPQAEINRILVKKGREGGLVVRLKGGDPFVFGRGGEECLELRAAGIPFEIVPGISSAVSVPAYAGIPVTQRGVACSFTVVTGHGCAGTDAAVDWQALPRTGTLVILMGVGQLGHIARELIDGGRDPQTPVAIVQDGTTPGQAVAEGTLATIEERARHIRPPATIVIGEVAALREKLDWFRPPVGQDGPSPFVDEPPVPLAAVRRPVPSTESLLERHVLG